MKTARLENVGLKESCPSSGGWSGRRENFSDAERVENREPFTFQRERDTDGLTIIRSVFLLAIPKSVLGRARIYHIPKGVPKPSFERSESINSSCMQAHRDHRWERWRTICRVILGRSWHIRQPRGFVCHLLQLTWEKSGNS